MWSEADGRPETGLLWLRDVGETSRADERLILEQAQRYQPTAVYVRRFADTRSAVPQVYLYDQTDQAFDPDRFAELHKRLWNFGQVPMFFVFSRDQVRIFNCYQPAFDREGRPISKPLETLRLAAETEKELAKRRNFSAREFDYGTFWDHSEYAKKFDRNKGAYVQLLRQLKATRRYFLQRKILEDQLAKRLLVLSILIKYLEDRKDDTGRSMFDYTPGYFARFAADAESYADVLRTTGACVGLFEDLSQHFNGEFFTLNEAEKQALMQADLNEFADLFVEGNMQGKQYTLWRMYSFEDLPVELISNIYEEFLDDDLNKKKELGIVYTPPYLVNLLIDECMPLDQPREPFKVLDPACGSGVFLVAAYRRMITWWRQQHGWQKPGQADVATLKALLRDNIFGVDQEEEAVKLAMFSLTLALCDELTPKAIWEELRFDDLKGRNLFAEDFFALLEQDRLATDFDLVIGNPPFKSKLNTPAAQAIERRRQQERPAVPDQQLALLFLDQAPQVAKAGGQICLIVKGGPLLYNQQGLAFRQAFFGAHRVQQVFDFTPLSRILFPSANVETAAIFYQTSPAAGDAVLHATFRRVKASKEKLFFDLDPYDLHWVTPSQIRENPWVWKTNLLGGGRLDELVQRLKSLPTLGEYLAARTDRPERPWQVGEGFNVGNRRTVAGHLTGKPMLPTSGLSHVGIDAEQIDTLKETGFEKPRTEKLFRPPLLLIKEIIDHEVIPVALHDSYLTFSKEIIGIHAPPEDLPELQQLESYLRGNRLPAFWAAATSSRLLIGRMSALLKQDILNLPYPEDLADLDLSETEAVLVEDVMEHWVEFRRLGEQAQAVRPIGPSDEGMLAQFADTFCQVMNSVYQQFRPAQPLRTESFIIFPFFYGEAPRFEFDDFEAAEAHLRQLLYTQPHPSLRFSRILRLYEHNLIYLIKPNQKRFWLRSVALRDADETFADLVAQGY